MVNSQAPEHDLPLLDDDELSDDVPPLISDSDSDSESDSESEGGDLTPLLDPLLDDTDSESDSESEDDVIEFTTLSIAIDIMESHIILPRCMYIQVDGGAGNCR